MEMNISIYSNFSEIHYYSVYVNVCSKVIDEDEGQEKKTDEETNNQLLPIGSSE